MVRDCLRREIASIREELEPTCEPEDIPTGEEQKVLDSVENEDLEIAANLDRMNLLLDRLNGLLRGRAEPERLKRHIIFREESIPMGWMLDFTSPDELQKFGNLPPITDEEMQSIDWECLFEKLRADEMK